MLLAFVFEFIGAFFLGATVTKTIRKSIVNFDAFEGEADLLLLGMTAASLWVYLPTKYSLPVSTTQSIVGAIVVFSIVAKGTDAVDGDALTQIALFWVFTPIFGCVACLILYTPTRHFVLNRQGDASYRLTLVFFVVGMMSTFLLFKGFKRLNALGDWSANPWLRTRCVVKYPMGGYVTKCYTLSLCFLAHRGLNCYDGAERHVMPDECVAKKRVKGVHFLF